MTYPIPATVEGFAQILDKEKPGWENLINIDVLDMAYHTNCILGQLYGGYSKYREQLFGPGHHLSMLESNIYKNDWIVAINARRNKIKVNDFAWALQQILKGKKVRHESWDKSSYYYYNTSGKLLRYNGTEVSLQDLALVAGFTPKWSEYTAEIMVKRGDRVKYHNNEEYIVAGCIGRYTLISLEDGNCWSSSVEIDNGNIQAFPLSKLLCGYNIEDWTKCS